MHSPHRLFVAGLTLLSVTLTACSDGSADRRNGRLTVVAATPDAGALVQAIAGDRVELTTLADGPADPHRVETTTQMTVALADADLLVVIGQGLEDGWLDEIVNVSKNDAIAPGASGRVSLDADMDIVAEGHDHHGHFHAGAMAASLHPTGDPHYLLDPVQGLVAAATLRDALAAADPDHADAYAAGYEALAADVLTRLVGPEAVDAHAASDLLHAIDHDELPALLNTPDTPLGTGLLAAFAPFAGSTYACDHDQWGYFADRYGLETVAMLETIPGVPPATDHLQSVVNTMRDRGSRLIVTVPYFDPSAAAFVAEATDARVVILAHQVQGVPEATDYPTTVQLNADRLLDALRSVQAAPDETAAVE